MRVDLGNLKKLLILMNFTAEDGYEDRYVKTYNNHANYSICVDFKENQINYNSSKIDGISLCDLTTSNLDKAENFVVLECVDRLLEKGYSPKSLTLEKNYLLGHKNKGKLDISVTDLENNTYLMIECKTVDELENEKDKMIKNGGQLFSYYVNDRAARYLCLYTSAIKDGHIDFKNYIVAAEESWKGLSNLEEIHGYWNKNFKTNGIFEKDIHPYKIEIKSLTRKDLTPLTKDDSGRIFNQFAEILRHNVVSDKPNAFNKILNIFICKIKDENKNNSMELDFQWKDNDTDEELHKRLNDLYKSGMNDFLDIRVSDYSDDELNRYLNQMDNPQIKNHVREMFNKLRLQKNPEFAFVEVYDDISFKINAKIVKEVVQLLQPYQFRYGHKQQFLGDFFELLLNTSMKQESGQFFTPVPICQFIVSSLPLRETIENRIKSDSHDVLPSVIDYACGTGHFLTEYMDFVQKIIETVDVSSANRNVQKHFNTWSNEGKLDWASDYVYGIDADYRLVKSAKVSSFLNGDGEANILCANGLDNFDLSDVYKKKLRRDSKISDEKLDNPQFDILIANPPYSISAFKQTIPYGNDSFTLFDYVTDKSSEIECLFVERAKQLLKVNGIAGIILPSSILDSSGVYLQTRKLLLKYFKIKAIVKLGKNTFMKTGTSTVILFMERRSNEDHKIVHDAVDCFIKTHSDNTILGIQHPFSAYSKHVYNVDLGEYISRFLNIPEEREKLETFILLMNQKIVLVDSGENKDEEVKFLGYTFSNARGKEGICLSSGMLFDNDNLSNSKKVNSYIYQSFLNEYPHIDNSLSGHVKHAMLVDHINWNTPFRYLIKPAVKIQMGKLPDGNVRLREICHTQSSNLVLENIERGGNYPVYGASGYLTNTATYQLDTDSIAIIKDGNGVGKCFIIPAKSSILGTMEYIIPNDRVDLVYLFYILKALNISRYKTGKSQPHVYFKEYGEEVVPLPDVNEQRLIAESLLDEEHIIEECKKEIHELEESIELRFTQVFENGSNFDKKPLDDLVEEMFIGPFGSSLKNDCFVDESKGFCMVYEQKHAIQKTLELPKRFISREKYEELKRFTIMPGDIIVSCRGTIGETFVVPSDAPIGVMHPSIMKIRLKGGYYSNIVFDLFLKRYISNNIDNSRGPVIKMAITAKELGKVYFPIPNMRLQNEFTDFVNLIDKTKTELQSKIDDARCIQKNIIDNIFKTTNSDTFKH